MIDKKQTKQAIKKNEEQIREILDRVVVFAALLTPDGKVLEANKAVLEKTGLKFEDALGKSFCNVSWWSYSDQVREQLCEAIRKAAAGESSRYDIDMRMAGGRFITVDFCLQPMFDESGKVIYLVPSAYDITERKQFEREREKLIIELEKQKAELEQFTLTISHDLKSPLITIKGFLTMLEQDIAKGELQRANADITRILNAADKMRILLDNLLKLSRIGRVVNPSQNVPLKDIVHDALDLVTGRIAKKTVRVEVTSELPHISVDRHRMIEVFQNLIDNAVKYMGNEPNPHIEIGARYDNGETVCYIRDNGIGIAPRYQERIFGLFDKLDQQSDGTGLGLAVVRRIIDVHGGRIWVESQGIGQGASFCFTVPTQKYVADYEK